MKKQLISVHKTGLIVLATGAALLGSLTFTGCGKDGGSEKKAGGGTLEGMAECNITDKDITYTVFLEVTTDDSGAIVSVKDAGTEVPDGKDDLYKKAQALFKELEGKTADTLSEVDTVSGATCSSEAILAAVQGALEG